MSMNDIKSASNSKYCTHFPTGLNLIVHLSSLHKDETHSIKFAEKVKHPTLVTYKILEYKQNMKPLPPSFVLLSVVREAAQFQFSHDLGTSRGNRTPVGHEMKFKM